MRKGIYRIEADFAVRDSATVYKGTEKLAVGLTYGEAEGVLNEIIEFKRQKLTELMLDIETQELVSEDQNFDAEKRKLAKVKVKELMQEYQDLQIEIGDL